MLSAEIYDQCVKHIKDHLHISFDKDLIIDPNASNNAFIDGIQSLAKMVLFYNKSPVHSDVMPLDFLQVDFDRFNKTFLSGLWFDDVHIICHPPPDRAEQFITAAGKFAESLSFIIPRKAQYAFPLHYQRLFSIDLPEKELVFQIWLKADY
jgi:hypothetical protein